jgi:nucleoside-diphosphate-sugar epimerase
LRILVIGSSGFIGRSLIDRLLGAGHAVEGWSRSSEPARAGYAHHSIDLLAAQGLADAGAPASRAWPRGPWDAAFHLAAHSVPGRTFASGQVLDNLRMAAHALDHLAIAQPGLRVIYLSSAHVYESRSEKKRETDALRPEGSYGLSKQLCEAWARARDRELRVIVVRAFNQIGPGMREGLLIPDLLHALRNGTGPVEMRGQDSTRDFLDVRDGTEALAKLATADVRSGGVLNLCSGEGRRVSFLARELMQRLGVRREIRFRPGTPPPLVGDPSELSRAIDWRPRYALADTLDDIVGREAR